MKHPLFPLAVSMRRVPVTNRWISEKWVLDALEAAAFADAVSRAAIDDNAWRWQGFALDLHPSEAEGYHLNLTAPDPRVFVMWRLEEFQGVETARPWVTTASYHEAARMMDSGETVDSLPMPADVRAWIEPWVAANYKPEVRKKHKRNEKFWGQDQAGAEPRSSVSEPVSEPELHPSRSVSEPDPDSAAPESARRSVSEPESARSSVSEPELKAREASEPEFKPRAVSEPEFKPRAVSEHEFNAQAEPKLPHVPDATPMPDSRLPVDGARRQ